MRNRLAHSEREGICCSCWAASLGPSWRVWTPAHPENPPEPFPMLDCPNINKADFWSVAVSTF